MSAHDLDLSNLTISICIPTYKRADLLAEALASCFAQSYLDYEIVVGDDSPDDATEQLIRGHLQSHPQVIRYQRNVPSLGQNANVNDLFRRAKGSRLVLLHDDDLLMPDALERLASCWEKLPSLDVAFGKQSLINHDGSPRPREESDHLNTGYYRTSENAGLQKTPIIAGILRMFPNDGYMVKTSLAQQVGYRSRQEVGDACDTDFGIRLCAVARSVWYLDEFTAQYRNSNESIAKTALPSPYTYEMLTQIQAPAEAATALSTAIQQIVPSAVSGFAQLGQTKKALRAYLSRDYSLRRRLSVRGMYHALLILQSLSKTPLRA